MGNSFLPGFAAVVMSAAFAASDASAQAIKPVNEPSVVSVDLLRHPVSSKVRRLIVSALDKMESGDHEAAIEQLQEMLAKYPDSAPYVHDLLGVAYVKTDRCESAVASFEQAVSALSHDPVTHYYLGLRCCARATMTVRRRRSKRR